jgi:hypothetical protein
VEKVCRLEVAVDDLALVDGVDGLEHLLPVEAAEVVREGLALGAAREQLCKVNVAVLHNQVDGARGRADLGVVQLHNGRPPLECLEQVDFVGVRRKRHALGRRHLDTLERVNLHVGGEDLVNLGRAALADHLQDEVRLAVDGDSVFRRWHWKRRRVRPGRWHGWLLVRLVPLVLLMPVLVLVLVLAVVLMPVPVLVLLMVVRL